MRPASNRDGALMARMAAATGADTGAALVAGRVAAAEIAAARRRCAACLHDAECAQWLSQRAGHALPPAFCANGSLFGRLIRSALTGVMR